MSKRDADQRLCATIAVPLVLEAGAIHAFLDHEVGGVKYPRTPGEKLRWLDRPGEEWNDALRLRGFTRDDSIAKWMRLVEDTYATDMNTARGRALSSARIAWDKDGEGDKETISYFTGLCARSAVESLIPHEEISGSFWRRPTALQKRALNIADIHRSTLRVVDDEIRNSQYKMLLDWPEATLEEFIRETVVQQWMRVASE